MSKQIVGGLDLGQSQDFSAFIVTDVEAFPELDPLPGYHVALQNRYSVRHIHRWPLSTPYTEIVRDLQRWYSLAPHWQGSTLIVDGTGVGRAVVDMIREAKLACNVLPYSITAGREPNDDTTDGKMPTVPKKDLVAAVQAVLQMRRVKFAGRLEHRETLEKELEGFRVKVDAITRNETFGEWRDGKNDDLVLSLALAIWYGEKDGPPAPYPLPKTTIGQQIDRFSRGRR